MNIVLKSPNKKDLIPLIGKRMSATGRGDVLTGRLVLVSDYFIGLTECGDRNAVAIKSQLGAIQDPIFYCDENEMVNWWRYRESTIEVLETVSPNKDNEDNEDNNDNESRGYQIQDAAWGEKNYTPPPKASFEFL